MARRKSTSKSKDKEKQEEQHPQKKDIGTKETNRVQNPHDQYFRRVFSRLDHVREFLEGFLPKEIADLIVLSQIAYINANYTDEDLLQHNYDLIFLVPLREVFGTEGDKKAPESVEVYFLFEHKSYPEESIIEQLLRYIAVRWLTDRENKRKPRVVVPIVFYHGKKEWDIDKEFEGIFKYVHPDLRKFIPKFDYVFINTADYSDEKISQLVSLGSLQTALLLLKYIHDKGLGDKLVEILTPMIDAKLPREELWPILEATLRYLAGRESNKLSDEVINNALKTVFRQAGEEVMMESIVDRWIDQGRLEGIEEGIEKGIEKGIEIGRQEAEREAERKLEQERQKTLAGHRETILGIVNHKLALDEAKQAKIIEQLERIDDEGTLRDLINSALDAAFGGEFTFFMMKLLFESEPDK
ncbi:MAG: Rpn family recombination-promoting nuclease/putative transposase [Chloroflexota bacterium]